MVDASILENYCIPLTPFQKEYLEVETTKYGLETVVANYYSRLDCTRVDNNGMRPMQTPTFIYKSEISELRYLIDNYVKNLLDKDKHLNKLIELHLKNLKYEEINPPVDYTKKRKNNKRITTSSKTSKEVKPKKDSNLSSAEAKLKEVGLKVNNLKLKL